MSLKVTQNSTYPKKSLKSFSLIIYKILVAPNIFILHREIICSMYNISNLYVIVHNYSNM